ncbi:MAG: hypothetical protein ACK5KO_07565 [Arachnia sp.]
MTNQPTGDQQSIIDDLVAQIRALEARVTSLEATRSIPDTDLIAIGAAVAAYLGFSAKVRSVRYGSQSRWVAESRGRVHDRSVRSR